MKITWNIPFLQLLCSFISFNKKNVWMNMQEVSFLIDLIFEKLLLDPAFSLQI